MGLRGPQPKSAHLRLLEGTLHQPGAKVAEPTESATMPDWLTDPVSRETWQLVVSSWPPGHFKQSDASLLAAYCSAASDLARCVAILSAQDLIVPGVEGDYINPAFNAKVKAAALLSSLATKLGIGSATRALPANRPSNRRRALMWNNEPTE